jgi:hypothetical protein
MLDSKNNLVSFIMKLNKSNLFRRFAKCSNFKLLEISSFLINSALISEEKIVLASRIPAQIYEDFTRIYKQIEFFPLIRVGGDLDGGYWIPDVLDKVDFCFSPGYGGMKSFENELSLYGITSFICDSRYKEIPDLKDSQFFYNFSLSSGTNLLENLISLKYWIDKSPASISTNLLLQMDIEGAEYDIFYSLERETIDKFGVIAIEIHDLQSLFVSDLFAIKFGVFWEKIGLNHTLIHYNDNLTAGFVKYKNRYFPRVIELTFIRNDWFKSV